MSKNLVPENKTSILGSQRQLIFDHPDILPSNPATIAALAEGHRQSLASVTYGPVLSAQKAGLDPTPEEEDDDETLPPENIATGKRSLWADEAIESIRRVARLFRIESYVFQDNGPPKTMLWEKIAAGQNALERMIAALEKDKKDCSKVLRLENLMQVKMPAGYETLPEELLAAAWRLSRLDGPCEGLLLRIPV